MMAPIEIRSFGPKRSTRNAWNGEKKVCRMMSSEKVNCSSASVVPSFWLSGPVDSVQTYCGLEIAIIAIKPSTSCIQRVDAVEPRASARVVVIANPPMITPAATTIGPVPGCRQGQQSGNGAKYTAFSKRAARLFPIRNGLKRRMARPVAIFDQCVLRRCSSIRAELSELPPEIGREGLVHVGRDRMPAGFDCNAARHATAGEEIQHRRARKRQRADDPPDKFLRLLGRMADAF